MEVDNFNVSHNFKLPGHKPNLFRSVSNIGSIFLRNRFVKEIKSKN